MQREQSISHSPYSIEWCREMKLSRRKSSEIILSASQDKTPVTGPKVLIVFVHRWLSPFCLVSPTELISELLESLIYALCRFTFSEQVARLSDCLMFKAIVSEIKYY